jgi:hypothetical protein
MKDEEACTADWSPQDGNTFKLKSLIELETNRKSDVEADERSNGLLLQAIVAKSTREGGAQFYGLRR